MLEVYSESDKNRLKTSVTSVNWARFIANDTKTLGDEKDKDVVDDFDFADEETQEYEQLISSQMAPGKSNSVIMDDGEEIDVDDI